MWRGILSEARDRRAGSRAESRVSGEAEAPAGLAQFENFPVEFGIRKEPLEVPVVEVVQ